MDADERRERLRLMLKAANTNATKASLAIGRSKDYLRDYLAGRKRDISAEEWQALTLYLKAETREVIAEYDADRRSGPLSDEQARVVEVLILAWLGWMSQHPAYQARLADSAVQAAAATIISQLSRSRRFHEQVARDPEAALQAIQLALDLTNEQ